MRRRVMLVAALVAKDWRLFLADRRAAALGFAVPILLASAFGLIFDRTAGTSGGSPRLPLLVVVEGDGPFLRGTVADLLASPRVEAEVVSRAEAEARIADRRPGVAVVFGADCERLAQWSPSAPGDRPRVAILHDPLCDSEAQWAEGVVTEVVMRRIATAKLSPYLGSSGDAAVSLPFRVETSAVAPEGSRGFNSYTHSFSGMTLQYLLFWGMESGLLLLRERQRPLWARMRSTPVSLGTVLLAKALATASIAFLQVMVTFGFGALVFGVSVGGSWVGFLVLALAVSALSAATGLLVAAVGGTEARARSVSILAILGVSLLGGLWMPSFVLPGWARDLALALPTTWAMRGLDGVTWQGRGLIDSIPAASVVVGFTAVFFLVAATRFVNSEARRRRGLT